MKSVTSCSPSFKSLELIENIRHTSIKAQQLKWEAGQQVSTTCSRCGDNIGSLKSWDLRPPQELYFPDVRVY